MRFDRGWRLGRPAVVSSDLTGSGAGWRVDSSPLQPAPGSAGSSRPRPVAPPPLRAPPSQFSLNHADAIASKIGDDSSSRSWPSVAVSDRSATGARLANLSDRLDAASDRP